MLSDGGLNLTWVDAGTNRTMKILSIDHIQLTMPEGQEHLAREFYGELLGMPEVEKPKSLAGRGGVWFEGGGLKVHLGVDSEFVAAQKAHPGFKASNIDLLATELQSKGFQVAAGSALPGIKRIFTNDPFGNRVEFLQDVEADVT